MRVWEVGGWGSEWEEREGGRWGLMLGGGIEEESYWLRRFWGGEGPGLGGVVGA